MPQHRLKSPFGPEDVKGRGIEAVATYLKKTGASDVKCDIAWSTLTDLRDLRNLIAHRAGTSSKKHQMTVNRLLERYKDDLEVDKTPMNWWNEVWISMELCRHFTNAVEAFLGRVVADLGAVASRESKSGRETTRIAAQPRPSG